MSCIPCEYARQRLEFKRNAVTQRAIQAAKEAGWAEVVVFVPEEGGDTFSFAESLPAGATGAEYFSVSASDV